MTTLVARSVANAVAAGAVVAMGVTGEAVVVCRVAGRLTDVLMTAGRTCDRANHCGHALHGNEHQEAEQNDFSNQRQHYA